VLAVRRHGACSMSPVLKLTPAALAFVCCTVSRLASAQTATAWRDSTDYLAKATPATEATSVNVEPQQGESDAPSVKPVRAWYGGQLLVGDAVTLSVLFTGVGLSYSDGSSAQAAPGVIWVGALGYALVPATIHVLHARPAIAVASTFMRVGSSGLGVMMGAMIECPITPAHGSSKEKCDTGPGPVIGLSAGVLLASLLDAGLFSYDRPSTENTTKKQTPQFGLSPYLSPDGKRGELRAFGTF
jgi:hypothetical protein